ncbi:MAG: hypothetical protein KDD70_09430 [Bdellovibrionales bacterium]|nr:hypothetical protein [Bdellovibrionales bacterium]
MEQSRSNEQITLYFHDDSIAYAFGELLNALGFNTETVSTLEELGGATKVITEPLFYDALSPEQKEQCLLVGNAYTSNDLTCPIIRQPLTPEKIQRGLQDFLGAAVAH